MQRKSPAAIPDDLVLEGIVVTLAADGATNIAPMGPRVDRSMTRMVLRPFRTSQTYKNVKVTGLGVFHVTDDVDLIAHAAAGQLLPPPSLSRIDGFVCPRLADACRWFAFEGVVADDSSERATIQCKIVGQAEIRPFLGFNRAKHAVVEASILATRVGIVSNGEIQADMQRLAVLVHKTGGLQERAAFEFLRDYINGRLTADS